MRSREKRVKLSVAERAGRSRVERGEAYQRKRPDLFDAILGQYRSGPADRP
jgi:hypothetical protein